MSTRRLNPVAWSEGMFLRPQHFQQADLYAEEQLRYHLKGIDPFHWGVRELVIDEEALSDNQLVVMRLGAVLPGGCVLRYPGNAVIAAREFDASAESVDVYVGLKMLAPNEPNAAESGDGVTDVRWIVQAEDVADLNRGGFEGPVEFRDHNLRIFLSGEEAELEGYESFKLAEIRATGELKKPFALVPSYAPPLLAIQAHEPLHDEVQKIVSQIAAKVRVVAGRTATIAIADLPRMWMRYTLARLTPVLRHLLSTGETSPFALYTTLVETAGALSAFRLSEPAELPEYDHEDLYGCYYRLIRMIDDELSEAVPDRFTELLLPWDGAQKAYSTPDLSVELVDPRNAFYLGVKASIDAAQLATLVVDEGKAGSQGGVPTLVLLAVKGLRIEHLPAAPTDIAARAGYEYFKIDPHGAQWAKVREEFSFAINLGKLENADVRLFVVTAGG